MSRFFKPIDMFSIMKPILYLSRVLGLAPFSTKCNAGKRVFVQSKRAFVYSSILLLAETCIKIGSLKFIFGDVGSGMFDVVIMVAQVCFYVRGFISHVLRLVYRNKVAVILTRLLEFDKYTNRCDSRRLYKQMLLIQMVHFVPYFVLIVTSVVVHYIQATPYYVIGVDFVNTLQDFVAGFQFTYLVIHLKIYFRALNDQLRDMLGGYDRKQDSPPWRMTSYRRTVCSISRRYDWLCGLSEAVNTAYSLQILASAALLFIESTYEVYYCGLCFFIWREFKGDSLWTLTLMPWLASYAFRVVSVTAACVATSSQADRTAVLVHKMLTKIDDPGVRQELQLFSLQMLHRKVRFTAYGFFPLDFTLLYSIVGAVTTYLVILIQFQLSFGVGQAAPTRQK